MATEELQYPHTSSYTASMEECAINMSSTQLLSQEMHSTSTSSTSSSSSSTPLEQHTEVLRVALALTHATKAYVEAIRSTDCLWHSQAVQTSITEVESSLSRLRRISLEVQNCLVSSSSFTSTSSSSLSPSSALRRSVSRLQEAMLSLKTSISRLYFVEITFASHISTISTTASSHNDHNNSDIGDGPILCAGSNSFERCFSSVDNDSVVAIQHTVKALLQNFEQILENRAEYLASVAYSKSPEALRTAGLDIVGNLLRDLKGIVVLDMKGMMMKIEGEGEGRNEKGQQQQQIQLQRRADDPLSHYVVSSDCSSKSSSSDATTTVPCCSCHLLHSSSLEGKCEHHSSSAASHGLRGSGNSNSSGSGSGMKQKTATSSSIIPLFATAQVVCLSDQTAISSSSSSSTHHQSTLTSPLVSMSPGGEDVSKWGTVIEIFSSMDVPIRILGTILILDDDHDGSGSVEGRSMQSHPTPRTHLSNRFQGLEIPLLPQQPPTPPTSSSSTTSSSSSSSFPQAMLAFPINSPPSSSTVIPGSAEAQYSMKVKTPVIKIARLLVKVVD